MEVSGELESERRGKVLSFVSWVSSGLQAGDHLSALTQTSCIECTLQLNALHCIWNTGMLHTTPHCLAAHCNSMHSIVSDTQACCTLHLTALLHTAHHWLELYLTHSHAAHYTSLPFTVPDTQACCTLHLTALHCTWHRGMLHTAQHYLALNLTNRHATHCTSLSWIVSDTHSWHLPQLHCI